MRRARPALLAAAALVAFPATRNAQPRSGRTLPRRSPRCGRRPACRAATSGRCWARTVDWICRAIVLRPPRPRHRGGLRRRAAARQPRPPPFILSSSSGSGSSSPARSWRDLFRGARCRFRGLHICRSSGVTPQQDALGFTWIGFMLRLSSAEHAHHGGRDLHALRAGRAARLRDGGVVRRRVVRRLLRHVRADQPVATRERVVGLQRLGGLPSLEPVAGTVCTVRA